MVGTRIFLSIFICNNFIAIYCNFISKAGLINFDLCLLFFVWFWTDIEQYWMYLRVLNKFWMVLNIIQIEWHLISMSPWTKRSGVEWVYSNNATAFYFYTQTAYFKNCVSVYFVSCTFLLVGFLDFANATLGMTQVGNCLRLWDSSISLTLHSEWHGKSW